jgi:hypothetical protein
MVGAPQGAEELDAEALPSAADLSPEFRSW